MTDIERIRALAQTFLDEEQVQLDACGEAGANQESARAKACRRILAEIDLLPAVTSPDRIPPAVRAELDDYASVGARPCLLVQAILQGNLYDVFAFSEHHHLANDEHGEVLSAMPAIVAYVREALHPSIYGSPEAVSRWITRPRS